MTAFVQIPDGMVAYGPEHPEYPNAPSDWTKGAAMQRDGQMSPEPLSWSHPWDQKGPDSGFSGIDRHAGDIIAYPIKTPNTV